MINECKEGMKFDGGKLRFDLLPVRPLMEVVKVFTLGAKKYTERNWERGIKWGRLYAAMIRHAMKWWAGEKYDPEDGQHHLASVITNALFLMELEETRPEFDDRESQNYPLFVEKAKEKEFQNNKKFIQPGCNCCVRNCVQNKGKNVKT